MTRAEKDRNSQEQPGESPFGDSLRHGSNLVAQRRLLGSYNQSRQKGKEVKVTGKKAEGRGWPGDGGLCFASTTMCLT